MLLTQLCMYRALTLAMKDNATNADMQVLMGDANMEVHPVSLQTLFFSFSRVVFVSIFQFQSRDQPRNRVGCLTA